MKVDKARENFRTRKILKNRFLNILDENVFTFLTNIPTSSANTVDGKIELTLHIHFIESSADIEKIDFVIKSLFIKKQSCRATTTIAPVEHDSDKTVK